MLLATTLAQVSRNDAAVATGILAILAGFAVILFAIYIICVIGLWKVYAKAGQPGWAALIPIYNIVVMLRVGGLPWHWVFAVFLPFIPFLGALALLVLQVMLLHRISTRFGQGVGFTIGLTLLGPIFWLILGFGDSKYLGEQPAQA